MPCKTRAALLAAILFSPNPFAETPTEVMTLEEVAQFLRVPPKDIQQLAESGELPARRINTQWRFHRQALLGWLDKSAMPDSPPLEKPATESTLSDQVLAQLSGRGAGDSSSASNAPAAEPQTIGVKSTTKTAEDVFLRDQGILLKRGQFTVEADFFYNRNDRQNHALQVGKTSTNIPFSALTELKGEVFTSNANLRYGVFDDLQAFADLPFSYLSYSESVKTNLSSEPLNKGTQTLWGNVSAGLRYVAVHEKVAYPSVILSVQGLFPTGAVPYGVGSGIALTKSFDPAILFANVDYQHRFNGQYQDFAQILPMDQINTSLGIAYALNDTLTLSTSVLGQFSFANRFDSQLNLPSNQYYRLSFALTSFLSEGLYIEPSVSFGLNGMGSDVTLGLSLPYTFGM